LWRLRQVDIERARLARIDERVSSAKTKIDRIASNSGKAVQLFASSTYPVTSGACGRAAVLACVLV
jgi:hypothetical protein